jgi:tRNA1Val (adenine37-N6)-methyltransferase
MPNSFFQFKQFIIHQDQCAMKVCTDACLFGAYAASLIKNSELKINDILDIGTGTGLLSLMLAQQTNADIDAVEISEAAYQQASSNFRSSAWNNRLHIYNTDIADFRSGKKYDLIISNPPFFENDLRSTDEIKNKAKHEGSLNLNELLKIAAGLLSAEGHFAVLLPYHRVEPAILMTEALELYCTNKIIVQQTTAHDPFRGMLVFSAHKKETEFMQMSIKDRAGKYTNEFILLLKDYYLYL